VRSPSSGTDVHLPLPLPFADLSAYAIALVYVAYFFGYYIRGSFGFGSNLPAVLITAWVFDPQHTVLLVSVVAGLMQTMLLPQGVDDAKWDRVIPVVIAMTIGSVGGVWLLKTLESDWMLLVLGVIVALLVLSDILALLKHLDRYMDVRSPRVIAALATVSSTMGTICGGGAIYLLVPFLKAAAKTTAEFRSTNIMIGGLSMMTRMFMMSYVGLITLDLAVEAVALLPAVALGTLAGTRFFKTASPERFFKALQMMLLVAAFALLARALATLF
jgi:uncharacterized membrane protein YfcA